MRNIMAFCALVASEALSKVPGPIFYVLSGSKNSKKSPKGHTFT